MGACFKSAEQPKKKLDSITKRGTATQQQLQNWLIQLGCRSNSVFPDSSSDFRHIQHKCFAQILKDVDRTFPESSYFMKEKGKERFINVLKKFSLYFPKTGYTQGLNFVAGYFLISGASENNAFLLLTKICSHQHLMFLGLYQDNFLLNKLYCELFWNILKKKLPRLFNILTKASLNDELWIFQWFMTFFIYSFPLYLVTNFLEYIWRKKKFAMVRIALGITKELQKLFTSKDYDDIYFVLEDLKIEQFCKKNLSLKKILSFADNIADSQFEDALKQTNCTENFYKKYFSVPDEERQVMYFNKMKLLSQERKQFLKNPNSQSFYRKEQHISVLDFILREQLNKMYCSLSFKRKISEQKRQSLPQRLWKSGLQNVAKMNDETIGKDETRDTK